MARQRVRRPAQLHQNLQRGQCSAGYGGGADCAECGGYGGGGGGVVGGDGVEAEFEGVGGGWEESG